MADNEFRVRPVTRYIVTHHISHVTEDKDEDSTCQCGEFENIEQAIRVGRALTDITPGATFEIVGRHGEVINAASS